MLNNFAYPLLGSEIALSVYPQLIKLIPATLEIQIAVRCITYSVLALLGYFINGSSSGKDIESISKKSKTSSIFFYLLMGIVNIFHIASSYISYKILPSGIAYSLFYTYPIFNLLFRNIFFDESIQIINYLYIIIAIIGVYLIYSNNDSDSDNDDKLPINSKLSIESSKEFSKESYDFFKKFTSKDTMIGLFSGIGSAFTESLMYLMVKADVSSISPFIQVLKTYILGGILSVGYLLKNLDKINLDWNYWTTLILFNSLVGFIGYVIRFFTIPRLTTLMFNSLIFIGVIFSYIWGYLFSNEKIKIANSLGTILILLSVFKINNK